ncbi:hypothetical protein [Rhodococcus sp. SORGH_AS_0303]|uniref:hypothetical protein n=1 Tax=Rhodococcus sp. SORGH_AS_0303 TaxID=3041753 RepID=UPI00278976B1|nr:hypothetical protein [Rhodococcus sp. SORGH_AS_0303]MDQ1202850.1 hypothetical protein [Rhodococcus sp. SORGH_AS_0303]
MNGMDLVYAEIKRRMDPEIQARMEQLAEHLFPAVKDGTPLEDVPTPPPLGTPAPSTAAARTLVQGLVLTVLSAIVGVVYTALGDDSFQVFELGDWAAVGTTAVTASGMALLAYVMRKIGR